MGLAVAEVLLPLFPLEVVLLPEAPLPLHIFEDRYKRMIGECLEAQSQGSDREEFGVVLAREAEMQKVGCSARILEVTRRYDDDRLDILTAGTRRFEVLYTKDEKPYLEGGVVFFDDEEESEAPTEEGTQRVRDMFREFVRRMPQTSEVSIDLPGPGDYYLSFRIAALLPADLAFKQQLLSVRSEADRLGRVAQAIEILTRKFDWTRKVRELAGGNGHAQPRT